VPYNESLFDSSTRERFFIHDTKHQPGLAMYLLEKGGGLDGVRQSLAFGGWTRPQHELSCRFPFQVQEAKLFLVLDNAPVNPTPPD